MGTIVAEVIDAGDRDSRGRRRMSVAQRADYVRAYRESGLPAPAAPTTASLEVRLADGVVVRGDDVQKLAVLVRALRS